MAELAQDQEDEFNALITDDDDGSEEEDLETALAKQLLATGTDE